MKRKKLYFELFLLIVATIAFIVGMLFNNLTVMLYGTTFMILISIVVSKTRQQEHVDEKFSKFIYDLKMVMNDARQKNK